MKAIGKGGEGQVNDAVKRLGKKNKDSPNARHNEILFKVGPLGKVRLEAARQKGGAKIGAHDDVHHVDAETRASVKKQLFSACDPFHIVRPHSNKIVMSYAVSMVEMAASSTS